jgi:integrase
MRGNITRRGKNSWRLKFDIPADFLTQERKTVFVTVRGTRQQAQQELTRRLFAVDAGTHVVPTSRTLTQWLDEWLEARRGLSPKTAERYRQLIDAQISPHLGRFLLQKLRPAQIEAWHGRLLSAGRARGGPLAARTVGHAHRVLRKALADAVRLEIISRNVVAAVPPPKVEAQELKILNAAQVADAKLKLRGPPIFAIAMTALATGVRRGELLALRLIDIDLDSAKLRVERSLEQTKAGGLRFKSPKTAHGRRTITLPAAAVQVLRDHRRQQLEQRLALGLGRPKDEALVFPAVDGSPRSPRALTKQWMAAVASRGLPRVSFHALRQSHASALIAAGVDVLTISRRLGHGSPTITLSVYGHLFANTDERAALAIDVAFGDLR